LRMHSLRWLVLLLAILFVANLVNAGDYQIRGAVAKGDFAWTPQNFAGFYYDIKNDLGTETLWFNLTEGYKLSGDEPRGITYATTAQNKVFERKAWGSYRIIWSEPLQVDNQLSNADSWREVHEEDQTALRSRIQDIHSSPA